MKRIHVYLLLLLVSEIITLGQDKPEEPDFTPSGSPFAKIYTNAHTQISESNNETGFAITRAYTEKSMTVFMYTSLKISRSTKSRYGKETL